MGNLSDIDSIRQSIRQIKLLIVCCYVFTFGVLVCGILATRKQPVEVPPVPVVPAAIVVRQPNIEDEAALAREKAAQDELARWKRLRAATKALIQSHSPRHQQLLKVLDSKEVSFDRFAFVVKVGSVDYFIVDKGKVTEVSKDMLLWETQSPESIAEYWARENLAEGDYHAKIISRSVDPPVSMDVVLTNKNTGMRHRMEFQGFTMPVA